MRWFRTPIVGEPNTNKRERPSVGSGDLANDSLLTYDTSQATTSPIDQPGMKSNKRP